MFGKGRITLDDIATGINYNNTPYTYNDKFSIVTPDIQSQQRFFTINNYTHKYLTKEKRSPYVEYISKPFGRFTRIPTPLTERTNSKLLIPMRLQDNEEKTEEVISKPVQPQPQEFVKECIKRCQSECKKRPIKRNRVSLKPRKFAIIPKHSSVSAFYIY